jgi:hypothetical protein
MIDALNLGVVDKDSKNLYEATLIQIMNEAEKQRQACVSRAEELRRQAAIADGQSHAFTQVSSIVYNIINGYISAAERQKNEEAAQAAEQAEKEEGKSAALEAEAVREAKKKAKMLRTAKE